MEVNLKGSGKTAAKMAKENSPASTEQSTKDSGKTANTMVRASLRLQLAKNIRANSKMENIFLKNTNSE